MGLFAGISNVIPYFGPIIGSVPAVLVGLLSDEPIKAVYALIALLIVQQIDGNIIVPKIVGDSVGLHPLFVLLAILIGAQFGLVGLILAVPTAGIMRLIIVKLSLRRTKSKES